jgi:uncharacterized Zn finger protein
MPDGATLQGVTLRAIRLWILALVTEVERVSALDAWTVDHVKDLTMEIVPLVLAAESCTEAGDGRTALLVLQAVTDGILECNPDDTVGPFVPLLPNLGQAWIEAILATDLTADEREKWADWLGGYPESIWRRPDDELALAAQSAREGWDHPPLVRILRGEIDASASRQIAACGSASPITTARLKVLERQGRLQEAANLARASGQSARCAALLARLGRCDEAMELGATTLVSADDALAVATALHDAGAAGLALAIGERGLALPGSRLALTLWLRDVAVARGDTARALQMAKAALYDRPYLPDYVRLRKIAGDGWPDIREEILDHLLRSGRSHASNKVEIFLEEGLVEAALDMAADLWFAHIVEPAVDAALLVCPLKVVPICRRWAEATLSDCTPDRVRFAERWLVRARDALHAAGVDEAWIDYKEWLLETHRLNRHVVAMLQRL